MQRIRIAAVARLFPWLVVLAAGLFALPAWADPATESAAKALQKTAIEQDSLNMDYPSAIKKLQTGIAKCGTSNCSANTRASLLRDLGAMQILGGNEGDGRSSFAQAIALDGSIDLDPAYKNPQLDAIWSDVKKKGASAGGGTGPAAGGPQPSGDFAHTPVTEELVRTPLPVYAEYNGSETLARVIVKYKAPGMAEWKPLDLKKAGDVGWGGMIPCKDVTQGTMQYYIQGFNAANDPVATSGTRNKSFTVPVKAQIAGDPPSLPGQPAPKQCGELAGAECPPDFPGCNNKKGSGEDCDKDEQCTSNACVGGKCADKKSGGDDCESDDECASGSCSDGKCAESKKGEGEDCESDDECTSGTCKDSKCTAPKNKNPRFFIGLQLGLDLYIAPGGQDVCKLNGAGTGPLNSGDPYACVNAGQAFPGSSAGINSAIQPSSTTQTDLVDGGFVHGPFTLALSFDYALNMNMLVGARLGYELLTVPVGAAFAPIHAEARFTYLVGKNAVMAKVAPMVFAGGGIGEFDAFVPVTVVAAGASGHTQANVNAWMTAGPAFATLGGGVHFAFSKHVFATGALRFQAAFGGTAGFIPGLVPELGVQYGF